MEVHLARVGLLKSCSKILSFYKRIVVEIKSEFLSNGFVIPLLYITFYSAWGQSEVGFYNVLALGGGRVFLWTHCHFYEWICRHGSTSLVNCSNTQHQSCLHVFVWFKIIWSHSLFSSLLGPWPAYMNKISQHFP